MLIAIEVCKSHIKKLLEFSTSTTPPATKTYCLQYKIGLDWLEECLLYPIYKLKKLDKLWQKLAKNLNFNLTFQKNVA